MDERDFGVWLRQELRARRLSQRQLADRSGVDHSTISRILTSGHVPTLRTAVRLAQGLGADAIPIRQVPGDPEHAVRRVEHALRADLTLSEAAIVRTMRVYLRERSPADSPSSAGSVGSSGSVGSVGSLGPARVGRRQP